ncbi:MAG: hypothetical protein AAGL98_01010 [Planctomycetota bacterium]
MPWFPQLCRNLGLTVHHLVKPDGAANKKTVSHTVEEQHVNPTTTLRRTTIEEIEVKPLTGTSRKESQKHQDQDQ